MDTSDLHLPASGESEDTELGDPQIQEERSGPVGAGWAEPARKMAGRVLALLTHAQGSLGGPSTPKSQGPKVSKEEPTALKVFIYSRGGQRATGQGARSQLPPYTPASVPSKPDRLAGGSLV